MGVNSYIKRTETSLNHCLEKNHLPIYCTLFTQRVFTIENPQQIEKDTMWMDQVRAPCSCIVWSICCSDPRLRGRKRATEPRGRHLTLPPVSNSTSPFHNWCLCAVTTARLRMDASWYACLFQRLYIAAGEIMALRVAGALHSIVSLALSLLGFTLNFELTAKWSNYSPCKKNKKLLTQPAILTRLGPWLHLCCVTSCN